MKKILVTGAKGQLGQCLKDIHLNYSELEILFCSKEELDIVDKEAVIDFFKTNEIDYCINTGAYTNVELAERDSITAHEVNAEAVQFLAAQCKKWRVVLIHISTDYVFDGEKRMPYSELDTTNPINEYGKSKLKGEEYILEEGCAHFIIRTSWLYSQYGNNFFTYILNCIKEKKIMTITTEQTGSPTNANDLAEVILKIIDSGSVQYGIYHFSNQGEATWFDFAEEILKGSNQFDAAKLVKTDHYRTFAERPLYSVLDNSKIETNFSIVPKQWKASLATMIH